MFKEHPKGLIVAFFANMGERFGFYTMMGILVLFLQAKFNLAPGKAGMIYSIFYFSIYALALLGGYGAAWIGRLGEADRRARDLLRLFDLEAWQDTLIESYSHGMRQKLLIASALVHSPDVIIVDEPMVGLDPKGARLIKELLRSFAAQGGTVFLSTHTLEVAESLCDRLAIIVNGQIKAYGTMADLRRDLELQNRTTAKTVAGMKDQLRSLEATIKQKDRDLAAEGDERRDHSRTDQTARNRVFNRGQTFFLAEERLGEHEQVVVDRDGRDLGQLLLKRAHALAGRWRGWRGRPARGWCAWLPSWPGPAKMLAFAFCT